MATLQICKMVCTDVPSSAGLQHYLLCIWRIVFLRFPNSKHCLKIDDFFKICSWLASIRSFPEFKIFLQICWILSLCHRMYCVSWNTPLCVRWRPTLPSTTTQIRWARSLERTRTGSASTTRCQTSMCRASPLGCCVSSWIESVWRIRN